MVNFIIFFLFIIETITIIILLTILYKQSNNNYQNQLAELEKLHNMAFTDVLTKIPNRAAYNRHISKLQKSMGKADKTSGIILLDIDNFKEINDVYGHLAGDKTLQSISAVLQEIFSGVNYSIYRIGGDEFAVIAENAIEKEIIDLLLEVREYEGNSGIYISKGYAIIHDKESFQDAFSKADEMLYADKYSRK